MARLQRVLPSRLQEMYHTRTLTCFFLSLFAGILFLDLMSIAVFYISWEAPYLTQRKSYLIKQGAEPWKILLTANDKFLALRRFSLVEQGGDSWNPMLAALDHLRTQPQQPLYAEIFFEQKIKFQYPPTSLLPLVFLRHIIFRNPEASRADVFPVLVWLSWLSVSITAFFVIRILHHSLTTYANTLVAHTTPGVFFLRCLLIWLITLEFYPVIKAYSLGQIQAFINTMFTILVWCWMHEKKTLAGTLAGIMCLIKPQYTLVLLWGLLRKEQVFTVSLACTAFAGLCLSLWLFGISAHLEYVNVLSFMSKHGETFYPNQSINGLLNRFLANGNNLQWEKHAFAPFNVFVYTGTLMSSIILTLSALFLPTKATGHGNIFDLSLIFLTSTIASPIAWEHHYGILLPLYAFLFPYLLGKPRIGRWKLLYLYISFMLCCNEIPATQLLAETPLNIMQSYLLAGALMLLGCLYVLRRRQNDVASVVPLSSHV